MSEEIFSETSKDFNLLENIVVSWGCGVAWFDPTGHHPQGETQIYVLCISS